MAKRKVWPKGGRSRVIPLYQGTVWVFTSRSKYNQAAEFLNSHPTENDCFGIALHSQRQLKVGKEDVYVLGIFDGKLETLVHELGHCVLDIMKNVGINAHDGGGEPFCYLLDDLFAHLSKGFKHT